MNYSAKSNKIETLVSKCLVVGVFSEGKTKQGPKLTASAGTLDKAGKQTISRILKKGDLTGEAGSALVLYDLPGVRAERVMLLGLGSERSLDANTLRKVATAAAKTANQHDLKAMDLSLFDKQYGGMDVGRMVRSVVEAIGHNQYRYEETKSKRKAPHALKAVSVIVDRASLKAAKAGVEIGAAISRGISLARELGDLPGNICTPSYLARQAKSMQKSLPIKTKVLDEAEMKKLKMGSLLSVSRGSREPAKLIIMEYRGGKKEDAPIVLVGKGLTFRCRRYLDQARVRHG